ncbi:MAG: glycosyltransferase family 39 protein [Anaerolineales bacterium]|nr:glycosyltransferase family 39 protein [Anaerolineales bacterium]
MDQENAHLLEKSEPTPTPERRPWRWLYIILFVYILTVGVYFRFIGIDWGEEQNLHPDERFLIWVGSDISPVESLTEYFDTENSTLNPHNMGHGFYVYGTLFMFITRYAVEWIYGFSNFGEMASIGRPLSAIADLFTVWLVYLIASRLYNRRAAILASAFYACAVLPIQLSHFFKEDTFTNVFTYLAVYLAVLISSCQPSAIRYPLDEGEQPLQEKSKWLDIILRFIKHPYFKWSFWFGAALGCAVACKVSAFPVAALLPGAFIIRGLAEKWQTDPLLFKKRVTEALVYCVLGAVVSLFIFRLAQPYAFSGPGFFGVKPNPAWVENIKEQRNQSTGDVDFPPALQWARRSILFSGKNLTVWGLGLPLGIFAWMGFLLAGWRMLKGDWQRHILLWGWTGGYFAWQSMANNPTMRYQLAVYPGLVIFAGWLGMLCLQWKTNDDSSEFVHPWVASWKQKSVTLLRLIWMVVKFAAPLAVILLTFAWAYAFTRIYTRPITRIAATRWIYQNVPGPINLHIQSNESVINQILPFQTEEVIRSDQPYHSRFEAKTDDVLTEVTLAYVRDQAGIPAMKTLQLILSGTDDNTILASASLSADFIPDGDPRGEGYTFTFPQAVEIVKGQSYALNLLIEDTLAELVIEGFAPANESSWDDGLPLRMDGYDGYGGIYKPELNFELYWDDNAEKLDRFTATLNQADYIFISSNRQWGTTTRVPERYPLTIAYYRNLIGCPEGKDIIWCYNVAKPGMFQGNMGFELVKVFESFPSVGNITINDQFAEEAFTVYDHPKVLIFKKADSYDPQKTADILGAVDLAHVVHVTPGQAGSQPADLMLPSARWIEQQEGGTWSQLFNTQSPLNRWQFLTVLVWYLTLALLGLLVYPLVRLALPGLADKGYPVTRIVGLLLLAFLVWVAGSIGISFSRLTITLVAIGIAIASAAAAYWQRQELQQEWRTRRKEFLIVEGLFLAFFVIDLLVRLGNPDLWHPWKGGEKPMDFAYINAILKSTTFPPYDPWFAGGYLNYYYYGLLVMGVPVKWLGIVPSIAYNLIIPSTFAMIAMGAFSLGWNLIKAGEKRLMSSEEDIKVDNSEERDANNDLESEESAHHSPLTVLHSFFSSFGTPLGVGLASALGTAVLGNMGIALMVFQGYQKLAAPGGVIEGASFLQKWVWAFTGFLDVVNGTSLPYSLGDWYWIPSRVIPAPNDVEPITEFPAFTVLYGDPHAHLFAIPVALLVLAFAFSVVLNKGRWRGIIGTACGFLLGGLAIGALYPINLSDIYTFLPVGIVALGYVYWRYGDNIRIAWPEKFPTETRRWIMVFCSIVLITLLAFLMYQPYRQWYGQGYSKIGIWSGTHTPLRSYLTHWGLFLFLIVSWMAWETRQWMATTPASDLLKLKRYQGVIWVAVGLMALVIFVLLFLGAAIAWLVLPLAAWAGVLLLRPGLSDNKRIVLFLTGTALVITLAVEVVYVKGDIGRMNTVFKFYLQAWVMFSVCAAAALGWLWKVQSKWLPGWRIPWQIVLGVLVAIAALYPIMAGMAKIKDRMTDQAPHTLDGMMYMGYAMYNERWGEMDLSQDYRAIRWMQENVQGSPVIVEANLRDLYRWGSRFSIYTGLPGVVGWEWHQQQQRALLPSSWVSDRIAEIEQFYTTTDVQQAVNFLKKYEVKYIVMGIQERGLYSGDGLDKFETANGVLWKDVYRDGQTVVYEVITR